MKLRHLKIENFRGITNLELELGDTTVLIGENNVGKTAILDAIRYALREVRSRRGCAFNAYDFHLSDATSDPTAAPPINIQLTFREDQPEEWSKELIGRLGRAGIAQDDGSGCTSVILKVGAHFDPVARDYVQDWEFRNMTGNAIPKVSDSTLYKFQNEVSYYYLAALRDATRHFDARGVFWRPFLKESELTPEARDEIEKRLSEINNLIISSHGSFTEVVDRLREVQHVIPMAGGDDLVSVDAIPARLFDTLARAQVNLNSGTGAKIPVNRHGEGIQSLAVLALFNAFLQAWNNGMPIIALEEPESHLHPSAIRALWQLVDSIPGQKIVSTHSGDLLSEVPSESVVRLFHQSGCTVAKRMKDVPLDDKKRRQFNYHIRHARGELLFARCWILGEGETEVTLLPELARVLGKSLERNGIRCIAYRQSDISLFIEVAEAMGIHWVALTDNDLQGKGDQGKVRAALELCEENDTLFIMPEENIEQHLCKSGFAHVYESFLTPESEAKIKVEKTDSNYHKQLTEAVKKHKIPAAHKVIEEIQNGKDVPLLLKMTINAAIKWANSYEQS
ncbi:MAG: DUF2813 domain-containing protein [Candidatus Methanomethylophilus sp.]|jgi:putative ATP-dependent endonuclease of OLD family|nr:DUF2813 domain-containing protein [Methanomethylophilus sp.]HHV13913.1 DUF2813 domain-containing protein [Clostridiales bacterium]